MGIPGAAAPIRSTTDQLSSPGKVKTRRPGAAHQTVCPADSGDGDMMTLIEKAQQEFDEAPRPRDGGYNSFDLMTLSNKWTVTRCPLRLYC